MSQNNNQNIVVEWLISLNLGQYSESFIDNGYDDLEICKQIGDPDLDAIGVININHRNRLLKSIKTLREEGAANVYFTLEESQLIQETCKNENKQEEQQQQAQITNFRGSTLIHSDQQSLKGGSSSNHSNSSKNSSLDKIEISPNKILKHQSNDNLITTVTNQQEFVDDYEEGKAQLVRIPKLQLKILIKDKLIQDNIKLSNQPYSTQDGERGYLEGLASRYADLFNTHYRDVLVHLEELRKREWAELSPRMKILGSSQIQPITPTSPPGPAPNSPNRAFPNSHLPTSQSQPIYVPGKYLPSSCLSDREEDEIYGFTGCNNVSIYGKQLLQRQKQLQQQQQQQQKQQAKLVVTNSNNYHSCLSPRSAYFYEFPPNERTSKKKTTFSRFLKTLKSSKNKDKRNHSNSPKHASSTVSRMNTPDCLRGETPTIFPPNVDCERLRGIPHHSNFEETINRLKLQDALEKKQRFDREHEEILRDIRTGLLHLNRSGSTGDDTYMYDDEMIRHYGQHWYDEPPYESDPEDFLMVGEHPNGGRVCYTLNNRPESAMNHNRPRALMTTVNNEGSVISLRSAGDISLLHNRHSRHSGHQRGILLPQTGMIIPLRNNNRESGDYAASDVQSISSRLSSISMETSRSDQIDSYHRLRSCNGGDSMTSPGHSSDYADEDLITLNSSCSGSTPLTNRARNLKSEPDQKDKYRKHSHQRYYHRKTGYKGGGGVGGGGASTLCHNSSAESLPSTCSTQVLLEDRQPKTTSVVITRAVALVDNTNSPYDKEALKFKKGDIINVISMSTSGLWRGYLVHDELKRVGTFKFINVKLIPLNTATSNTTLNHHSNRKYKRYDDEDDEHYRHRPKTLHRLLRTIEMENLMSLFVLNGYDDLESFCEIQEEDLDFLNITDEEHRAKILAAVQVMHEYESPDDDEEEEDSSLDEDDNSFSGKHARNNLDSEHSTDDTRSTNTTSTTIVSNNSSLIMNTNGKSDLITPPEVSDTIVTCGDKIQVIKYVPGEVECDSGNPNLNSISSSKNNYCGYSEKSSDSGVSSSSVSSGNLNSKQPIRRCNGVVNGGGSGGGSVVGGGGGIGIPLNINGTTCTGGSKVALIERSSRSYVGHFMRKPQNYQMHE